MFMTEAVGRNAAEVLADVLPNPVHRTLPGQTHQFSAAVVSPVIAEFFAG